MGILDKLKTLIRITKESSEFKIVFDNSVKEAVGDKSNLYRVNFSNLEIYNQIIKKWDDEKRFAFVLFLTKFLELDLKPFLVRSNKDKNEFGMANEIIRELFKSKMKLSEDTIISFYNQYMNTVSKSDYGKLYWDIIVSFYKQIEFNYSNRKLPEPIKKILEDIIIPLCKFYPSPKFYLDCLNLKSKYNFSYYDTLIISTALEMKCKFIYSEDFLHNKKISSLKIINPFLSSNTQIY